MHVRSVEKLVMEFSDLHVEWVGVSGGEPLLHPEIEAICRKIASHDIRVSIMSNGLLLAEKAKKLAHLCDDLFLSLDGPPMVHNRIRNVPEAYNQLAAGISRVRAEGKRNNIWARCTVQKLNIGFLRETVSAAIKLGLDRISFLPVDVHSQAFGRSGTRSLPQCSLVESDLELLSEEIDLMEKENRSEFSDRFIAESPAKLRSTLIGYFAGVLKQAEFPIKRCNAPWVSVVIEANGDVRPCFFHPVIGNIHSQSLHAVINSWKARQFRQNLNPTDHPTCRKCVCPMYYSEGKDKAS